MDISINFQDDYRLNIRAAAIIIHNNKILMHHDIVAGHYALLGGRVAIGEDSMQTIKREIFEEMEKEIEVKEYAATIENFFPGEGRKTHEIQFVYKAEFADEKDKALQTTIKNLEGNENIQYEWLDLNKIDEYPILPLVVKDILKENNYPTHKIQKD